MRDLVAAERGHGAWAGGCKGRQPDSDQILLGHGLLCRGKGSGLVG